MGDPGKSGVICDTGYELVDQMMDYDEGCTPAKGINGVEELD